jgi:hypothetical protein
MRQSTCSTVRAIRLSPEASDLGKEAVLAGGKAEVRLAQWCGPGQDTRIGLGAGLAHSPAPFFISSKL